ncbi:MAG: putative ABC transporter permease [Lachnospiraceae bacterium]|nr:putative ABC transporter permease [Lachnospiraceae bacterium]
MEILFTALKSLHRRDLSLKGNSSLWMFPIYGCAALLTPLFKLLKNVPVIFRGLTYMGMIFSGEYLSGSILRRHSICPWDYCRSRFNIKSVIRLDFAPNWFAAGLFFEWLLTESPLAYGRNRQKDLQS